VEVPFAKDEVAFVCPAAGAGLLAKSDIGIINTLKTAIPI
jgi:hypothetical protein